MTEYTTYIHYGSNIYDPAKVGIPHTIYNPYKPNRGLWACRINSDYTWKDWCESEEFRLNALNKSFTFTLKDTANILQINELNDIKPYLIIDENNYFNTQIDWETIYKLYNGIELMNGILCHMFCYSDDYASNLFYSWDVASICVWNKDVILTKEE